MPKKLNITLIENNEKKEISVDEGIKVHSILHNFQTLKNTIYGIKINNEICSLDSKLTYDCDIEPVLNNSKSGAEIYRRSLCFILAAAAYNVCPEKRLLVGHSLGHGYYYTFDGETSVSNDLINSLRKEMEKLISQDILIQTSNVSYQKACQIFDGLCLKETRKQLDYNCPPHIAINILGDFFADLYVSPLVYSTGVLKLFDLLQYKSGFLLRFPSSSEPDKLENFEDQPKLYEIYEKYKEWGRRVDVTSVASLNKLIANRKINDFID
ncbi:MAG: nucleoside kinase, partial [Spirochaetia bacterium]|nr:nucleoside kinase [Spirochaetia bacterium]